MDTTYSTEDVFVQKMLYDRDVAHCQTSTYVKEVTIKEIRPAQNSDKLDSITFEETGRFALVGRDSHKIGDKVFFIPAESILPNKLAEELNITGYLSKGKVRVVKLRGNRSEGLVVDREKVMPYLDFIMKWEDRPTMHMSGNPQAMVDVPLEFEKFYKMPNLLDEPHIFEIGEAIAYSEKIHGTSGRFGNLRHPITNEYGLYVGSHNVVLKETESNLYWATIKKMLTNIGAFEGNNMDHLRDIIFYCEIFGENIQHLSYGAKLPDLRVFAMKRNYGYLHVDSIMDTCATFEIPTVRFHKTKFESLEQMRALADSPSEMTDKHMREGIVIVSLDQPDKMAKVIGFEYLTHKNRTERK